MYLLTTISKFDCQTRMIEPISLFLKSTKLDRFAKKEPKPNIPYYLSLYAHIYIYKLFLLLYSWPQVTKISQKRIMQEAGVSLNVLKYHELRLSNMLQHRCQVKMSFHKWNDIIHTQISIKTRVNPFPTGYQLALPGQAVKSYLI